MGGSDASQPDFRALFDALPGPHLVVLPDAPRYTIVAVSDAYARATRTKREDLVGRGIFEVLPDLAQTLATSLEQVIRTNARVEADGTNVPVFGPSGELGYIIHHEAGDTRARCDLALQGAQMAMWDWNVRTGAVDFSPRWAEMRGLRPENVAPHIDAWSTGVHPDDMTNVQRALEAHFSGRTEYYRAEYRVRTSSGKWLWVFDLGRVVARDVDGQPLRMVGIELDVTERKELEEELRIAEATSSGILSISPDAIISIDESQRITLFNEGAEAIFGYARDEVIGAPLNILLPERLRALHDRLVEKFAAETAASRRVSERKRPIVGRRKNGAEFPADAAISKLEIAGRRVMTVALRDITEQRRVENEQKLLAEMGAAIATTLDYDETLANIARMTVRGVADVCVVDVVEDDEARRLEVVSHDSRLAPICEALKRFPPDRTRSELARRLFNTKQTILIERVTSEVLDLVAQTDEHRRLLQKLNPQSAVAVPLLARGRLIGAMAFVSTNGARLYTPADLRLIEELARRAALAIENARLHLAAVRALRARDEVLGIVAHDLRNPLATILMQASLLERDKLGPDAVQPTGERIHRAATRMNLLIQDLLDVSRIEAGRLGIDRRATDTREVVSEAVESQRSRAAEASVRLVPLVSDNAPEAFADRERLLQVFENLIGNALKYTRAGGVVSVGAEPREGNLVFWVADTGSGIPAEQLPHVFERFWQARSVGRGGAGLGLAIVKGIVEEHGGRVWVESRVDRGSTFFFTIPAVARRATSPSERADRAERYSRPSTPA